jgi:hypothetical protein
MALTSMHSVYYNQWWRFRPPLQPIRRGGWPGAGSRLELDWGGVAVFDLARLAFDEGNQEFLDSLAVRGGQDLEEVVVGNAHGRIAVSE